MSEGIQGVRPTHEETDDLPHGFTIAFADTLQIQYKIDVLGRDLFNDREAAIEMYAQMAADRIRRFLAPVKVRRSP